MYATLFAYTRLSSFCPTVSPLRANLLASKSTYAVPLRTMLLYCALRSNAYCFVSTYSLTLSTFATTSFKSSTFVASSFTTISCSSESVATTLTLPASYIAESIVPSIASVSPAMSKAFVLLRSSVSSISSMSSFTLSPITSPNVVVIVSTNSFALLKSVPTTTSPIEIVALLLSTAISISSPKSFVEIFK